MKNTNRLSAFKKKIPRYQRDPVLYCREVLLFEPDHWQAQALQDLAQHPKVSIRSGQGVGKTGMEACALLWFLTCFPFPKVIATAPTRQQLHDVLWAEISKCQSKSPLLKKILKWTKTKIYMKNYEERWFATARTATKAENMQGFHEDYMLFIVDEASGVADPIMEAILGTLSGTNNKLLLCGNPTRTTGVFYDSHHGDRSLYKSYKVSSRDSSRTNKENIEALIKKYGAESNVVRVRIDGEFPLAEDDVFIPLSLVEQAAIAEFEDHQTYSIHLGVDVARFGDDETVIASKVNQRVLPLLVKHGQDLMGTAGDTLFICNQLREKYKYNGKVYVKIDDTGLGGGVTDRLGEIKREQQLDWLIIIPINFSQSIQNQYYADITTYTWGMIKELMESSEISIPNENDLIAQLSVRRFYMTSGGKLKLESKKEMKKRGIKSPDRADALALACLPINDKADKGSEERKTAERRSGGARR